MANEFSGGEPATVWDALRLFRMTVENLREELFNATLRDDASARDSGGSRPLHLDDLERFVPAETCMVLSDTGPYVRWDDLGGLLAVSESLPPGARARVQRATGQEPTSTSHAITLMEAAIEGAREVAGDCEQRANDALAELHAVKRAHHHFLEQLLVVLPVDSKVVPEGERTWPPTTKELTACLQRVVTALDLARGRAAAADLEAGRHLQALHQREREFHALLLALRMIARLMGEGW